MVAEFLAGDFFHFADIFHDFSLDLIVDFAAVLVVLGAGFGGNGEALRNRQAQVGHFSQVRALAAQQFTHFAVTFGEKVNILLLHCDLPP